MVNDDGTDQKAVVVGPSGDDREPTLSPDGSRIAFVSSRSGHYGLYVVDTSGANLKPVLVDTFDNVHPSWSPDGTRLVFTRSGLHLINVDGTGLTALTTDPSDREPSWSPDGVRIAFTSGQGCIWVIDVGGTNWLPLTDCPAGEGEAAWSPDGATIAFTRYVVSSQDIMRINADGSNLVNLTNTPSLGEAQVAWSPDGTWIAYAGLRDVNQRILKRKIGSGGEGTIAKYGAYNANPSWHAGP